MKPSVIPTNITGPVRQLRRHAKSIVVWLLALLGTGLLLQQRGAKLQAYGVVEGQEQQIAATTFGRIISLPVQLLDHVEKGQLLAVLDDRALQAELETEQARIQALQAELHAAGEQLNLDSHARQDALAMSLRRLAVDRDQSQLRILEIKTELEPDRIRLRELQLAQRAAEELAVQGLISPLKQEQARENVNQMQAKIVKNEGLLAQAEHHLAQAESRLADYRASVPRTIQEDPSGSGLEVIRKRILVQSKRLQELEVKLKALYLIAPFAGTLVAVDASQGQAVQPGKTLMTLAASRPEGVLSFRTSGTAGKFTPGTPVRLTRLDGSGQSVETRVLRSSTTMVKVPERVSPQPGRESWGQPFVVAVPHDFELVVGERVALHEL